jgi:hypothetical protein
MPQENSQSQLTTEAKTVLGRLGQTEWAAIEAGLSHLARQADSRSLSDLRNKRTDEAYEEAVTGEVLRSATKLLKGLLK